VMTKADEVIEVESPSDTRDDSEIKIRGKSTQEMSFQDVWIGNQVKLKA